MNIYLVRHGESTAQTQEEFGIDTGLSEKGRGQAAALGNILDGIYFDEIRLSPLLRASETFEFSGIERSGVIFDSRLVEAMPEHAYDELLPYDYPSYGKADIYNAWNTDIASRMKSFLDDILKGGTESLLVISHGMALSSLLKIFLGADGESAQNCYCFMNNAAVSLLDYNELSGDRKLLAWNSATLPDLIK